MTTTPRPPGARLHSASARKPKIRLPVKLREQQGDAPGNRHWRAYFLAHLIETSNVSAAAKAAGVATARAYRTRQEDSEFAGQWRSALIQGYENLEMELLGYLRDPAPERKLDVANAIRLLSLHRQTIAQQRAQSDERSEQEVLESIDAMIDQMRQRAAANAALLGEADDLDEPGE